MTANAFPCIMIFFFNIFDGFHLYFFPFYFLFYSLFNLVNSIIALVPNTVEVEWQLKMLFVQLLCLFVSRVRLMECLLPDGHVRICSVPHRHDTPLPTPLRGHTLGCQTFDLVFTGSETRLFCFIFTLSLAICSGKERWVLEDAGLSCYFAGPQSRYDQKMRFILKYQTISKCFELIVK